MEQRIYNVFCHYWASDFGSDDSLTGALGEVLEYTSQRIAALTRLPVTVARHLLEFLEDSQLPLQEALEVSKGRPQTLMHSEMACTFAALEVANDADADAVLEIAILETADTNAV